jgi:SAM-dependent methyltransferase
MIKDSLHRFSDRVDNYVRYRPHYPAELIPFLKQQALLNDASLVADIGSGTGISCEPFLKNGNTVYGIEPNKEMREAAEAHLQTYKNLFKSIDGSAEGTSLENSCVDLIVAGQAFHWFNRERSKQEFKRILKPGGHVLLMWNDRKTEADGFLRSYEDFLQLFGTDYKEVNHKNTQDEKIFNEFFGKGEYKTASFPNYQDLNFEGLKGRVLSSSYMPGEDHKDFEFMIYCLKKIFVRYQVNGTVRFEYDTKLYYGQLK